MVLWLRLPGAFQPPGYSRGNDSSSLAQHRPVSEPSARTGSNQKRDVGFARANCGQRKLAVEMRVPFLIQLNQRCIHDNGSTRSAAVRVTYQRALDLLNCSRRADGISGSEDEAADIEIDFASLKIDARVATERGPRAWRAHDCSGARADDVVSLDDANHRLPAKGVF